MAAQPQVAIDLMRKLEIAATVKMTHPAGYHDEYAGPTVESTKEIKRSRKEIYRTCAACQAIDSKEAPFRVCSQCQMPSYCSRQCQKHDWPKHKEQCHESERQKRSETLVKNIEANSHLMAYLKIATILRLDLINSPAIDEPFSVLVHLGIEPPDILDFARLRGQIGSSGTTNSAKNIKGMVQINDVVPCPEEMLDKETLLSLSSSKRAAADAEGFTSDSVGIMLFVVGGLSTGITVPVHIMSRFPDIARQALPFEQIIMEKNMSRPQMMDVGSCIEYINTTIRLDKDNRLLLRTDMTAVDENVIKDSVMGRASVVLAFVGTHQLGIGLLRARMEREYIYRVLLGLPTPGI